MSVLCQVFVIHRNKIDKLSKVKVRYLQHRHMFMFNFVIFSNYYQCQCVNDSKSILTEMVSTDLKSLRLSHNKPNFSSNLMLQKLHSSCPSFLPLIPCLVKSVQFCFSTHKSHKHHTKITKTSQQQNKITETSRNYTK